MNIDNRIYIYTYINICAAMIGSEKLYGYHYEIVSNYAFCGVVGWSSPLCLGVGINLL